MHLHTSLSLRCAAFTTSIQRQSLAAWTSTFALEPSILGIFKSFFWQFSCFGPHAIMDSPMHSGKYSFNRGRGRGYQGRGRPFVDTSWRSRGPAIQPPSPKLGFMLAIINHSDLTPSTDDPKITNCTDIASYNWMNRKIPTVFIPGISSPFPIQYHDLLFV